MLVSVLFQIGKFGLAKTVITDGPCKDSRHGDNSVNEGSFHYDDSFREEHHYTFNKNGYIQLKKLIDKRALQAFWRKHFKDADHTKLGSEGQPRRFKIWIKDKVLADATKVFKPVFFVAYQMIAGEVHRDMSPIPYNSSIDWLGKLKRDLNYAMHSHNNAAMPGSVFQNPHWDVPNTKSQGMVLVDIPLIDVKAAHAPLEIWKGTHRADYRRIFDEPEVIVGATNAKRQYWYCNEEILNAAMNRPSSLVHSRVGDATVRTPATWHRGTPNNSSVTRDMMTFLIQPSKKGPKHRK